MDQLRKEAVDTAVVPINLDNKAICNNSIGPLSGITRRSWVTSRPLFGNNTKRASDNQPGDNTTKEASDSVENNEATAPDQATNTPPRAVVTTPSPPPRPTTLPPPHASLPPRPPPSKRSLSPPTYLSVDPATSHAPRNVKVSISTPETVASNKTPLARPRSISNVQAELLSLANSSQLQSRTQASSQGGIPTGKQTPCAPHASSVEPVASESHTDGEPIAHTSTDANALTSTPNEVASNEVPLTQSKKSRDRDAQTDPNRPEVDEWEAQKFQSWLTADRDKVIPNPNFAGQRNKEDSQIFANQCCKTYNNKAVGRRLVLFPDGSDYPNSRTAAVAVAYKKLYDLDTTLEPPWIEEAYGVIRLHEAGVQETIGLIAALNIVEREAKNFFATPHWGPGGKLEPLLVYIFTDSLAALGDLENVVKMGGKGLRRKKDPRRRDPHMRQLMNVWRGLQKDVHADRLILHLHWVKGHAKAIGNVRADKLASHTSSVVSKFNSGRPPSSPLGQGYEVFSLEDMELDLLARSVNRRHGTSMVKKRDLGAEQLTKEDGEERQKGRGAVDQRELLYQIRILLADFSEEMRVTYAEQNRTGFGELKSQVAKLKEVWTRRQGEDVKQDTLNGIKKIFADFFKETLENSEKVNKLAFDKLRKELSARSLEQEVQSAQAENMMMAIEEATSEWRKVLAVQSGEIKALRKEMAAKSALKQDHVNAPAESMRQVVKEARECSQAFVVTQSLDVQTFEKIVEERLRALREEMEGTPKTITEAAINRGAEKDGAGGGNEVNSLVEEVDEDQEELRVEEVRHAVADEGQAEAMTSCASSGETVFGETEAQTAGSDVREDDGDSSMAKDKKNKKLRLRVVVPASLRKSVRKLRIPFARASSKSKVSADSRA
ncbi:hypothetical protein PG987_000591 [Apiospora arundinis]